MAETGKKVADTIREVMEATAPDAPKKNAVAAEPTHLKNDAEDLGPAVVKPTDSNPDATKKVKEVSGQAPQKSEGAPDTMPKLDDKHPTKAMEGKETKDSEDKEIKEGDLPPALQKAIDKKKEKSENKDDSKEVKETIDAGEVSKEKDAKKEVNQKTANVSEEEETKEKKEDKKEIDVKEHIDALIAGEDDLSEEFKTKAATVFETAIKSKLKEMAEDMQTAYDKKFVEESSKSKDELVEKVDSYLAYVVEEWMKENELALERGIKGEIAEDFISGLKKLFEDHYIDVPDEKYNVLEDQSSKIDELNKKT